MDQGVAGAHGRQVSCAHVSWGSVSWTRWPGSEAMLGQGHRHLVERDRGACEVLEQCWSPLAQLPV